VEASEAMPGVQLVKVNKAFAIDITVIFAMDRQPG
jgi:hypothetical protein